MDNELVYEIINKADLVKSLKCAEYYFGGNMIIGLNSGVTKYIVLPESFKGEYFMTSTEYSNIINCAPFITGINDYGNNRYEIYSTTKTPIIYIDTNVNLEISLQELKRHINGITNIKELITDKIVIPETDVTDDINNIVDEMKYNGSYHTFYHYNNYIISIFSGLLPVNKGDKLYLTIHDKIYYNPGIFLASFVIVKKKTDLRINIDLPILKI